MRKRTSMWGIYALAVTIATITAELRAQDGQGYTPGYFAADQTRSPEMSSQPQMVAASQPKSGGNTPPDYSALPPAGGYYDADLAKRVADLEKQLANYAKAADAAKAKSSAKPLIAPSGRIQFDMANFSQNATSVTQYGNALNSVGFRRARLALLGEYEVVDYVIEMDFANRGVGAEVNSKDQSTGFKDVYIQVRDFPLIGNVRVGHFKEGFGLEQMTSDNYTTFMERSIIDEGTFVPGRNNGIQAFNWTESQRATWSIGGFTNQTGFDQPPLFQYDQWGLAATARGTYLAWYDEPSGGRGLLHTGLDYTYRSAPDHKQIFATRAESGFSPSVVNMTLTDVIDWQVFGTEAALVYGPFSMQSEFYASTLNRQKGVSNNFYGMYAFASYFLTGESRPYNRKLGVFDRVRPYEDFFRVRTGDGDVQTGHGAWEVAYRFSYIDMLDGLTAKGAGLAADHTFGVNWYLNPFTKVMFNYVHSMDTYNLTAGQRISGGNMDIFETRFAMDF
jgi:phosphate-selective porin OprO and OprP